MNISEFLTYDEAIKSPTAIAKGIDNTPNAEQLENMRYVAVEIFDPCRRHIGGPLHASSFFRSIKLNKVIGGASTTSQHPKGQAVDMDADTFGNGTNVLIFNFIRTSLEFDQVIGEYPDASGKFSWVHASKVRPPGKNRKQVLVKLKEKYIPFSQYKVGMI